MPLLEGPLLERLTHRLAECPGEFLGSPRIGNSGEIPVEAVISDLAMDMGGGFLSESELKAFMGTQPSDLGRLQIILVAAWVFHDPELCASRRYAKMALSTLLEISKALDGKVSPQRLIQDPERREELVRLCLQGLQLMPKGETEAHALDRLHAISLVERERVVRETQAKLQRARELAEAMRRKEAEEAAARANRE